MQISAFRLSATFFYYSMLSSFYIKRSKKHRALILAYHHILPKNKIYQNSLMPGMYLSSEAFEMQLAWLKKNFKFVPLEKIIQDIKNRRQWLSPLCAITFDDGWKDIYDYALEPLRKYGVPATVFLIGDSIGTSDPNCWDTCFEVMQNANEMPSQLTGNLAIDKFIKGSLIKDKKEMARRVINIMRKLSYDEFGSVCKNLKNYYCKNFDVKAVNWKYSTLSFDDIREMIKHDIDFGYHSKNHYMLSKVPMNKLSSEIELPEEIVKRNGINIKNIFCYPDGKLNNHIIAALKKQNYSGAVSLIKGFNSPETNPYILRRVNLHEGNSATLPMFLATIGLFNQ